MYLSFFVKPNSYNWGPFSGEKGFIPSFSRPCGGPHHSFSQFKIEEILSSEEGTSLVAQGGTTLKSMYDIWHQNGLRVNYYDWGSKIFCS